VTRLAIEARLWETADELRANSHLKSSEYSVPVLSLIFLKYADSRFAVLDKELAGKGSGRRQVGKTDYQALGVLYVPDAARFSRLVQLKGGGQRRQGHQRRHGGDRGGKPRLERVIRGPTNR
jgi:type I restriction enzyme M protein